MTSVAEALRQHAPEYLRRQALTTATIAIRKAFSAIVRCRTGALGGVERQCVRCGRSHWTGRSCGNRHCATCGSEKTHQWLDRQSAKLLPAVHHFLITFTVPRELRSVLRAHPRAGYRCLFDASAAAIRDVAGATKSLMGCKLGFFGVLHTWGRDPLVYHPHIHFVIPGGGVTVDDAGQATGWKQTPTNFFVHHDTLIRVYKAKLADALRACGLYEQIPSDAWKKKFVVDIKPVENGRAVVAYLAPYVHRVAISNHRITRVDATSVTYKYQPSRSKRLKTRSVAGQDFVGGFAQHLLPKGFQKVRHYGWMSSNSKIRLEEVRILAWLALGWVYWLASAHGSCEKQPSFPILRCAACGGQMRIVSVTNHEPRLTLANHGLAFLDSG
jgi:hypothetical protein